MSKPVIEDIYALSPSQQGMLFHLLFGGEKGQIYFDQYVSTLAGPLDTAAWHQTWIRVLERHAVLRTQFVWERREQPLQVVRRDVELPWQEHDWRDLPAAEREERFAAFLREDHDRGFDLTKAPLTRVAIIRFSNEETKFVWSFHHLVVDGWSMGLILGESYSIYQALVQGREPGLARPRPFRDYVAWVQKQDVARAESFWRRTLGGFRLANPLPFDGTGAGGDPTGWLSREEILHLSPELTAALRAYARQHQLTLNTLAQGAWSLLLGRYSGADDVAFGAIVAGRPPELDGVESMAGLFINALPVRVPLPADQPAATWLKALQEQQTEQREFEYSPIDQILAWSEVGRKGKLFETMLVFENYPIDALRTGSTELGVEVRDVHLSESGNFPLTLYIMAKGDFLELRLNYHWTRIDRASALRILSHLHTLLRNLTARPGALLRDLEILAPEERRELLAAGRGPASGEPAAPVLRLFEAQAARTPGSLAVESKAGRLTYAELEGRSTALARHLHGLGVGPESIVGLHAERSTEMIVAMLAVWKAGGAYLPLDPAYPQERLAFMLEDSGARVVLTQEKLAGSLAASSAQVVRLDAEPPAASVELPETGLGNIAYVIYTSGSTGRPKGVLVPHASLANYVRVAGDEYGIGSEDRVLQFASMSFDTSAEEIYPALTRGAALVLRDEEMASSLERFARETGERGITVLDLPTAYWHEMVAEMVEQDLAVPASLRLVILGGEQAQADRLAAWRERVGERVRLVNSYGPTEATIVSTHRDLTHGIASAEVPIGRAIPNARTYVLDRSQELVPVGIEGELLIGGAGLARGYLGRPDLTAERFVPDAFGSEPGARLYRTGDLVRLLADGDLEFRGRADDQVKVRGFRIELGEIEAALRRLPGVRDAVVAAREDGTSGKRLVAYVVPGGEAAPSPADLRSALKESLPEYMVPGVFVMLETLPTTPSGKVDRRALPAPDPGRPELDASFEAPRNPVQEVLAGIWSDLLGVDRVGVHDDFFQLGGHSLLVAKLAARVRQAFKVELSLVQVFQNPTVAALAERIERPGEGGEFPELPPIRRVPRDRPIPLSFPQERVWFLDQLTPGGNIAYNFQVTIWFEGALRPDVFEATLQEIVRRHEVLRTSFPAVDGQPVQVVHEPWQVELPVIDLRTLPDPLRYQESERLVFESTQTPFDVARLPLVRWRMLRLTDDLWELIQVEQHFVHDGWSFGVMLKEIKAIYAAFLDGEPSPLPELPVQYADFAAWQRELMEGGGMEHLLGFWRKRLAGSSNFLELPTDRPRPNGPSFAGDITLFRLPVELYASLRAFSRREGFTLYMTMLAGFFALLNRYTRQEDILLGTNNANRRARELEGIIGMMVNTLVVRGDLSGNPDFRTLLGRTREVSLETYAHQDTPFERLVQELRPERQPGRNPLFQVMFNFHDAAVPDLDFAGLRGVFRVRGNRSAKMDMNVIVVPGAEQRVGLAANELDLRAVLHWEYNTDLFDFSTVQRMIEHFLTLLAAVIENPRLELSELPLLTEAERRQLVTEWNDTAAEIPDRALHELFEATAAHTPGAVALSFEGWKLTYGEIDAHANRLARHLRRLGVGAETLVGLSTERSPDMLLGLLAVLKAGGAYVPLDPTYPADRLAYVIEDAKIPVLLTQEPLRRTLFADSDARVVEINGEAWAAEIAAPLPPLAGPENRAYVIYTSGSTGRPKGVEVRHRAAVNFLASMARRPGLAAGDVLLAVTTLSFDIALLELFLPLAVGARIELAGRETAADGSRLAALLAESGATAMQATPATWRVLLESGWEGSPGLKVLCGGEALPRDLADRLLGRVGSLWNVYGPTETTVWSALHQVEPGARPVPVGQPVANTAIHLLDRSLRPVPVNIEGELYIGGEGLARGYLGRPDLTAERFVPDPFGSPGARLYHTGDVARRLPSGDVEFVGRADHQVKVRGFRIELGEIEAVLASHPAVRQCAVVVREEGAGDRRLVAWVVAGEEEPRPRELRAFLNGKLPDYMVPGAFVVLPELPLTPNGKVDRRALAQWAASPGAAVADEEPAQPRSPVEEVVAAVFADLLGRERVGIHDSFFEQGGHSLLATRAVSRVRDALGVEIPLRVFFAAPTVAGLARAVERVRSEGGLPAAPPIVPLSPELRQGALPVSFAQRRLWFLDRLAPESSAYNLTFALRLGGLLDLDALGRSLGEIVRRHETLRTRFAAVEGEPVQIVSPPAPFELAVADLSALAAEDRERETTRLATAEAGLPFDLAAPRGGSLLRVTLVKLAPAEHAMLLTLHHIVADGWSLGLFVRELGGLYAAFAAGSPSPLSELPVQYADFAAWQRSWLTGGVLAEQLDWWRGHLEGVPASLELPTDRTRPTVQTHRGSRVSLAVPREVAAPLEAGGWQRGVTPFMTLFSAFAALLSRYSGQSDLVIGIPIANRSRSEVEDLIGLFANTLALRADLGGDPLFTELTARVREAALGAYAHQDLPFEKLVDELRPERSLSHSPLFQVMLTLQNMPLHGLDLPGLALSPLPFEAGRAQFELSLLLVPTPSGIAARLDYNSGLFDRGTAERMARHFSNLLSALATDPERRLSEIPLLSDEERREVLVEWNRTAADFPRDVPVHRLVLERAARTPEAPAVSFAGGTWSYGELAIRAGRLARRLKAQGIGPESVVALVFDRSPELVAAALGVLQAGGVYLPVDPSSPEERIAFLREDSGAAAVLTLADLEGGDGPALPGEIPVDAGNLAYVIYTSGSTGQPKGVQVSHGSLANLAAWHRSTYEVAPGDRASLVAGPGFDASVWEMWPALTAGACLVIPEESVRLSPERLAEWLREEEVTLSFLPTPLAEAVLDLEGDLALPSLRALLTGGDRLHRIRRPLPFRLVNHYGPTESTVVATSGEAVPGDRDPSIGRPIANTAAYLLGPEGQPVPPGAAGELYLGGEGIARGYAGRPDLTAERFVPDPFAGTPGARLYRTGDLARFQEGGEIAFLGRADHQVKIRGYRIEPGEIESVLAAHPAVRECAVVAREERLIAWIVPSGAAEPKELRSFLASRLPEAMVPSVFFPLDALPLTPNGKVDRRDLSRRPLPLEAETPAHAEPRSPVEEVLAGIWAGLLGRERVGIHDNFFELGGHSLLATRVVSRVRDTLGAEIPLRALFEEPTVAGLAAVVERTRRGEEAPQAPPIHPVPRTGALPLSFAQQRLWFLDQLEPGSSAYVISFALHLAGGLDRAAFGRALSEIVRRHETLRTRFVLEEGDPVQVVAEPFPAAPPVVDLSGLAEEAREGEALRLAAALGRRPVDLAAPEGGSLLRVTLVKLAERGHAMLVSLHHIVADGWSMGVFVRELGALYAAFATGRPAALPALPVQYADFASWQRGWLAGEVLEAQLGWWRRHLTGAPPVLDLPTDRPRPAVQTHRGERLSVALPRELASGLEAEGWRRGVTPFMTLFAAFAALLSRASGQEDLVIGTPIAGRNRSEVEDLIGLFANTLALRADLGGAPSFADLALRVRESALGAYAHQDLPFEKLVDELEVRRDLSHSPLFQVLFTLQNTPQGGLELPGIALSRLPVETGQVQFDLTLNLAPAREGLVARFDWNADLFDRATVERLAGWYRNLLAAVAADPSRPVAALPLLTEAERRNLLVRNDTGAPIPDGAVRTLFERTAARLPEAVAVSFEGESLTYGALNLRANRLAHHLRGLGVGPEVPVGLYVERSPDMLVGLLAVLKAGGAYVPLDPAYPAERLAWVAEDARIPVLLTQRRRAGTLPGLWRSAVREVHVDDEAAFAGAGGENPTPEGGPESLAYVLYTSGSTGRPKGVEIRQRAVVNFLLSMARRPGLAEGDVMVAVTTLSFDIAVLELLLPLSVGGRVELVGRETAQDPARLAAVIEASGATAMQATPATWRLLLEGGWEGRRGFKVLCGGEALSRDLADRLRERVGSLWNVYGPTETTVWSAVHPVGADAASQTVPIGQPIANTALYLVDSRFEPALPGAAGELLIGGEGLARGYRGRPDLTAERFLPDPFGDPGGRLYRTGDLARLRSDGEIEFLGRADHQVKVRGFRIELGEIEAVLAEHPGLRRAVVMAREAAAGERRLAAWVVPAGEAVPSAGELRAFLEGRLPEYMVPSVFVPLAELPLTPNGKVDRRALPEPERGGVEERVYTAPRTAAERVLAAVWAEVLRLEKVGVDDNFFELGGDSILSIRVVVRSRKAGLLFTPAQLFQHQTVAALARVADASGLGAGARATPLSPFQRRVLESAIPGRWNEAVLVGLPDGLDPERAEASLQSLVDRHETLRIRFRDGRLEAAPAGEPVVLERIDLSGITPEERNAALLARAAEIRDRLDPVNGPMLRAAWFGLGEAACLLLSVHRLAADGLSLERLLSELAGEPVSVALREETEVSLTLGTEETRALLESVPALYGNTVEEVLLAAVLEAFGSWTGTRCLNVEAELDLPGSGTVEVPVRLEAAGGAAESLKGTKEALREALRHTPDGPRAADVFFRFRGRLGMVEPLASGRGEASRHPLEISAVAAAGRLRIDWAWDAGVHRPAAVRALAESYAQTLRSFIRHAESPEAGGFTPSDFLEAGLDQRELDDLLAEL